MTLTDADIAQMNERENSQPIEFFQDFVKSITIYEDDDIWVLDKPVWTIERRWATTQGKPTISTATSES